jgi:hypothetical protein
MKRFIVRFVAGSLLACACSSKSPTGDDDGRSMPRDDMAVVPAGWFSMGCYRLFAADDATQADESADTTTRMWSCVKEDPPRRVWLSSFEIDRFEVTNDDYELCLNAGACKETSISGRGTGRSKALPALLTFEDATRYCSWRGKRLPTDAEWQKAARGTDDRIYPWGDERPTCQHVHDAKVLRDGFDADLCSDRSHLVVDAERVGMHPAGASPYGVHDLLGTVEEWVSDWYARTERGISLPAGFTFSRRQAKGGIILEYDWSAVTFPWSDPSLVNPQGPPAPAPPVPQLHATKPGFYGISGVDTGDPDIHTLRGSYAGVRCVRSVKGPPPPSVRTPAPGEFTLPYREPGYAPPGTPTAESNAQPRKAHSKR